MWRAVQNGTVLVVHIVVVQDDEPKSPAVGVGSTVSNAKPLMVMDPRPEAAVFRGSTNVTAKQ